MAFEAKLDQFSGPLQLLLELIESEKMEITDVSLAKVTDDYLSHLDQQDVPSAELADFLVVAAKLLFLKSRAILPEPPIEEEGADTLAAQLKLYREFVAATEHIASLAMSGRVAHARPRTLTVPEGKFLPPSNVNTNALTHAFEQLLKRLQPFFALRQASMEKVVSVQERIKQIRDVLLSRAQMSFRDIAGSASSRVDVVVSFLALLELMKQRVIHAVQKNAFGDIELKRVD